MADVDVECGHPVCSRIVRGSSHNDAVDHATELGWKRHYVYGNPWRCDLHLHPSLIELTADQLIAARVAFSRDGEDAPIQPIVHIEHGGSTVVLFPGQSTRGRAPWLGDVVIERQPDRGSIVTLFANREHGWRSDTEIAKQLAPIPMLLWCPLCHTRHIDEGEFATKPHASHSCQSCGLTWKPAKVDTVGVLFLPGYGPKEK